MVISLQLPWRVGLLKSALLWPLSEGTPTPCWKRGICLNLYHEHLLDPLEMKWTEPTLLWTPELYTLLASIPRHWQFANDSSGFLPRGRLWGREYIRIVCLCLTSKGSLLSEISEPAGPWVCSAAEALLVSSDRDCGMSFFFFSFKKLPGDWNFAFWSDPLDIYFIFSTVRGWR